MIKMILCLFVSSHIFGASLPKKTMLDQVTSIRLANSREYYVTTFNVFPTKLKVIAEKKELMTCLRDSNHRYKTKKVTYNSDWFVIACE